FRHGRHATQSAAATPIGAGREGAQRLVADVGVDNKVIVAVLLSIVVEVTIEPTGSAGDVDVGVEAEVIIAVQFSVEVRIAAVGIHDDFLAAGQGLAGEGLADPAQFIGAGDGEAGQDAGAGGGGLAGDDAGAGPCPAIAAGCDQSSHG